MSIADQLKTIKDNVPKVFEAGKDAEHKYFWDNFISASEGTSGFGYTPYRFAGAGWNDNNFRPTKNLIFKHSASGLFRNSRITNLKKCIEDCNISFDTSRATGLENAFAYSNLIYLPKISLKSAGIATSYIFGGDKIEIDENGVYVKGGNKITWIDELEISTSNTFTGSFNYCNRLRHIIFTSVDSDASISNKIDLQWSPLDKESIVSIIKNLSPTVTLVVNSEGKVIVDPTLYLSKSAVEAAFTGEEWDSIKEGADTEVTVTPIDINGKTGESYTTTISKPSNWTISLV